MGKVEHDSATPAHGQQVITAVAFIYRKVDGLVKLFMPRRADTKAFLPGKFELPGGHIDFGEDIIVGLKREIKEEFDMEISVGDPFGCFTYTNEVKGSHSIEVAYFAQFMDPLDKIKAHPDDHSEFGWYSRTELEDILDKDVEYHVVQKGFDLLEGKKLNFS